MAAHWHNETVVLVQFTEDKTLKEAKIILAPIVRHFDDADAVVSAKINTRWSGSSYLKYQKDRFGTPSKYSSNRVHLGVRPSHCVASYSMVTVLPFQGGT